LSHIFSSYSYIILLYIRIKKVFIFSFFLGAWGPKWELIIMKKGSLSSGLKLTVPASDWGSFSTKFLWASLLIQCVCFVCGFGWFELWVFGCGRSESESETFKAVDLLVDKEGVRVVSEKEEEAVTFFSLTFYVLHFISSLFEKCVCSIGLVSCFSFGFDLLILMKCFLWQEGVPELVLFDKMGNFFV